MVYGQKWGVTDDKNGLYKWGQVGSRLAWFKLKEKNRVIQTEMGCGTWKKEREIYLHLLGYRVQLVDVGEHGRVTRVPTAEHFLEQISGESRHARVEEKESALEQSAHLRLDGYLRHAYIDW